MAANVGYPTALSETQIRLISKALADPRRHEILHHISQGHDSLACSQLRDCISVTPATLSHHMKELETAGLVVITRQGKFATYALQRNVLNAYLETLKKL